MLESINHSKYKCCDHYGLISKGLRVLVRFLV
jgi:hypothetical protein